MISSLWLQTGCGYCQGSDLDYNGVVDFLDFADFALNWQIRDVEYQNIGRGDSLIALAFP